jgi:hypothetical protein
MKVPESHRSVIGGGTQSSAIRRKGELLYGFSSTAKLADLFTRFTLEDSYASVF